MRHSCFLLATILCLCACSTPPKTAPRPSAVLEFRDGNWFDGQTFAQKTFYAINETLTSDRPDRVDSVLDLTGKFVVPPFADAHIHNLNEDDGINADITADLTDGVFYAMEMDPAIELSPKVLASVNRPSSVNVAYTQGLVTPSWGVMPDMYLMLAGMGRFGVRKTLPQLDTREVFLIDNESDLEKKWPALAAKNHDFIKVIVAFSEEQTQRTTHAAKFKAKPPEYSAKAGIAPEVLKSLVARAHAAGLRVAAHIETAADFRLALDSGVDIIAHLPASWQIGRKTGFADGSLAHWELTAEDAQRASVKHAIVVTTLVKASNDPDAAKYREVYRHNLGLLRERGVRLVIGTDMRGSVPEEVLYIASFGIYNNGALLDILTRATPQAIFPRRKIGELRDGFEASFLALDANPLDHLENIKKISLRVKQGKILHLATPADQPPH